MQLVQITIVGPDGVREDRYIPAHAVPTAINIAKAKGYTVEALQDTLDAVSDDDALTELKALLPKLRVLASKVNL